MLRLPPPPPGQQLEYYLPSGSQESPQDKGAKCTRNFLGAQFPSTPAAPKFLPQQLISVTWR